MHDFHGTFNDLLHAANLRHGTDDFASPPKEGVLRIFSPLNPRTWVLKASTLPLDHRSRFAQFLEWEMFPAKVVEEIKTHILCSVTLFKQNLAFCEIMWKNTVEPNKLQMTTSLMRIAFWYEHILRICNTYCFSTAIMLQWKSNKQ
jgi:hypothetical protein